MKNLKKVSGIVLEALPNTQFIIEIEGGHQIRCYISGKMKMHRIRVIVGDRVVVELTTTILIKNQIGRITLRK